MIQVRKVQPKDMDYILSNAEMLSYRNNLMAGYLESMMVVVNNGIICGIGFGMTVDDKCLLSWIHVGEEYRRDRMGTVLVKTILNKLEQNGAKTAYMIGSCREFAEFLKFHKLEDAAETDIIMELYRNAGADASGDLYKADLQDYFKPCCAQ